MSKQINSLLTIILLVAGSIGAARGGTPVVQIKVQHISCAGLSDGQLDLILASGALPVNFQWTNLLTGALGIGQMTVLNQAFALGGLEAGDYRFTFTGADGADTTMQRSLLSPAPLQGQLFILTNSFGYAVPCAASQQGVVLYDVSGGTPPFTYSWSNGDSGIRADSLGAGLVFVTLTDSRGCTLQADTVLVEPPPLSAGIELEGETCFGQNTGRIQVLSVNGGIPPYQYTLNGGPPGAVSEWTDLPYGQYLLDITDAAGCAYKAGAILPSGLEFTFKIGPDTTLYSGDTIRLSVQSDPPATALVWQPSQGVQVLSPTEVLLFPYFSTDYRVTAIGPKGCLAVDDLRVTVNRNRDVFVPNIFAPGAKNPANQRFTVYSGPGVQYVAQLQVYDRFGRLWFDKRQFPPNDPAAGWDGADGPDTAPPGVYLWRATLRYTDGREVFQQGDLTVFH